MLRLVRIARAFAALVMCCAIASTVSSAQAPVPSITNRVRIDPKRPIDFHAIVTPETLFVGQQATYQVGVFLDEVARMRLRRNPEFLPPELRGLLSYELGAQAASPPRDVGGKKYASHVFQRALFPLASGTLTIPAAQLTYALPQSSSYFSREESYVVRAESALIVVKPLPDVGRPADFTGAVGVLKAVARFDAASARVGDPIVLTLRIQGSGNVKLLPRPTLEVEWASAVAGTERLQVDTSGQVVRGAKEFDWILTPTRAGDVATPVIEYSYFDPYLAKYQVAAAAPVPISIRTGSLATNADTDEQTQLMPLREQDGGSVADLITNNPFYWLLLIAMPLPALLLLRRPTVKQKKHTSPVDALQLISRRAEHAPAKPDVHAKISASATSTTGDARRAFLAALAQRLGVHADAITERSRLDRMLRRRGVTRECTAEVLDLLARLDVAAFAADSGGAGGTNTNDVARFAREAVDLYQQVDTEALHSSIAQLPEPRRRARSGIAIVFAAIAGASTLISASNQLHAQSAAGDPFAAAISAYNRRQFLEAADLFQKLAIASPRNASALTNWGVAAWASGDTVGAVIAWQRAARLEPLAADLQQHLALLPAGARGGIAEVPLVPVNWLAAATFALWFVGCALLGLVGWIARKNAAGKGREHQWMKVTAAVALVCGAACGAATIWGTRVLRAEGLAVVLRPETMRASPAPESDAIGGAATGDVVRIDSREPQWAHVQHSDGRVGWLPTQRLLALTDDSAIR